MLQLAYTISPYLIRYLERIEAFRQQLLLFPLQPKRELGLQFIATVERIHFGLALQEEYVHPEKIKTIIANQIVFATQKKIPYKDKIQTNTIRYKKVLDYIKRDWILATEPITIATIEELFSLSEGSAEIAPRKRIHEVLTYLQASDDNPFIQAALAKFLFRGLSEETKKTEAFSTMASYLFLYRAGMDCRGLLVLEKLWAKERKHFEGYYQTSLAKTNLTNWLEYFIKTVSSELEETYQSLQQAANKREEEKIGNLQERQKAIMTLVDDPQAIITNRTVQKIFHISPITASRDLAKLASLGLLIQQGKGRSVRYIRI